jgi:hypothetical protein
MSGTYVLEEEKVHGPNEIAGAGVAADNSHRSTRFAAPSLRDGDIIFHTSESAQSAAIQRATHSRYSHVGLVLYREGKPFVFEAISTVRYTPLASWIARGDDGRYVVKRLKKTLTAEQVRKLRAAAEKYAVSLRLVLRVVRRAYLLFGARLEGIPRGPGH